MVTQNAVRPLHKRCFRATISVGLEQTCPGVKLCRVPLARRALRPPILRSLRRGGRLITCTGLRRIYVGFTFVPFGPDPGG
jgi:hypothetical protein